MNLTDRTAPAPFRSDAGCASVPIEIWGGIEALADHAAAAAAARDSEPKLTQGPKLDDSPGHASQNEVDALFASS